MNQVGGIASYNGNFWYNKGTNASDGNQETDFQELVDNAGHEDSGENESAKNSCIEKCHGKNKWLEHQAKSRIEIWLNRMC